MYISYAVNQTSLRNLFWFALTKYVGR